MVTLFDVKEHTQKIAEVISSVLDMQVIICDNRRNILGDSYLDWSEKNGVDGVLSELSILTKVMEFGKQIILERKELNEGCAKCPNNEQCVVKSIVGVPILYRGSVVGSVGILADTEESKANLMNKMEYYLNFTYQMSDLIVSKMNEMENSLQLKIANENLLTTINAMDTGILYVDEQGMVTSYNQAILDFIDEGDLMRGDAAIGSLIPHESIKALGTGSESFRNREILFNNKGKMVSTLVSGNSIQVDGKYLGAILTIKRLSDFYDEVNELSHGSNFMSFDYIIGDSEEIQQVKKRAAHVANSTSTVLIQGESGTGKELFARAIHYGSSLSDKPFVAINCAAIPETLLESELFGYEEGAFTGARKSGQIGKFQLADGGTIYLDEIEEMPIHLQSKLLRVIQERKIDKLGGKVSIPINVRIIASTNKDLEEMIRNGSFREDLFYRLNVIPIQIPPLRERRGDIRVLYNYFLRELNLKLGKSIKGFTQDVEDALLRREWKGNVRELQNVVECAMNIAAGEYITLEDLPFASKKEPETETAGSLIQSGDEILKKQIAEGLKLYGNNLAGKETLAKALGISRATLYRKMKQFRIPLA